MFLRKKTLSNKFNFSKLSLKTKSLGSIGIISTLTCTAVCFLTAGFLAVKYPVDSNYQKSNFVNVNSTHSLSLKVDSAFPVAINESNPTIQPGESSVQKEAREKAEAEAKAKSLAVAKNNRINVVSRERRVYNDPADFSGIYKAAENKYGVDARLLQAIHYVETGCSGSTTKANPSGAAGPMQFIAGTFARHAQDGNGDGVLDRYNVEDSIFTAASYLKACGYPNLKSALHGYNPSTAYYYKVSKVARSLGMDV